MAQNQQNVVNEGRSKHFSEDYPDLKVARICHFLHRSVTLVAHFWHCTDVALLPTGVILQNHKKNKQSTMVSLKKVTRKSIMIKSRNSISEPIIMYLVNIFVFSAPVWKNIFLTQEAVCDQPGLKFNIPILFVIHIYSSSQLYPFYVFSLLLLHWSLPFFPKTIFITGHTQLH